MNRDIVQGVIAILVVAGAIVSAFLNEAAASVLIPIASFVVGYYFKSKEEVAVGAVKKLFSKKDCNC